MSLLNFDSKSFAFSNRLFRIWYLKKNYSKLIIHNFRKFGIIYPLRMQFPYAFPVSRSPLSLSIEFTNYCNLKCPYCTSPTTKRKRGLMDDETLDKLVQEISDNKIRRVRIVGNGEPTLHPKIFEYLIELKKVTPILSITTNGQFKQPGVIDALASGHLDLINVSVDSHIKEIYEQRRIGGKFEKLTQNLNKLKYKNRQNKNRTIINIRTMITPSDKSELDHIVNFWENFGDLVSPQYISNIYSSSIEQEDIFYAKNVDTIPKCVLPFKVLDVHWNGNIPLCSYSEVQLDSDTGLLLGNINDISLQTIWNNKEINKYRNSHRHNKYDNIPMCKGCVGT